MKQKTNIMRSGSRPSPEGTRLLSAGTVSPMMCPADGQQTVDEKGQTEDKPRWGQRQSRKKQEQTTTRWWVFVEFVLAWCVEGIRCDIAWYIAVYRDIIAHIKRYHKIRYIEVLHPYPEFLGVTSRYRIPWKYFSIPVSYTHLTLPTICSV